MTATTKHSYEMDAAKEMPRLLLLTHYYPAHRGGIEIVAGQLATRLAEHYEIHWLAADCDPPPTIPEIKCEPQRAWNKLETKGLPWPIWTLQGWKNLRRAIVECDILHIHDFIYPAHLIGTLLAWRLKKPVVITQHIGDIEYRNPVLRIILKAVNRTFGRWMLNRANQVVFISARVKTSFEEYTHFFRPPLYWPNGVDTQIFRPVDPVAQTMLWRANGLDSATPVILFVGRFVERKGLRLLQQMAAARPEWQWCFAGWGPLDPTAWDLPNVRVWNGLQGTSLAPLYQLADLLILPSHGEGFPLVVQESLACGTPVVVSEETAAGGPTLPGSIIPIPYSPYDPSPDTWLLAIENRLESEKTEDRRRERAEQAKLLWSWEQLANNYRALFEQLICSKHASKTRPISLGQLD